MHPRSLAFGILHKLSPFSDAREGGQVTGSTRFANFIGMIAKL
jgi:hypothetical protein